MLPLSWLALVFLAFAGVDASDPRNDYGNSSTHRDYSHYCQAYDHDLDEWHLDFSQDPRAWVGCIYGERYFSPRDHFSNTDKLKKFAQRIYREQISGPRPALAINNGKRQIKRYCTDGSAEEAEGIWWCSDHEYRGGSGYRVKKYRYVFATRSRFAVILALGHAVHWDRLAQKGEYIAYQNEANRLEKLGLKREQYNHSRNLSYRCVVLGLLREYADLSNDYYDPLSKWCEQWGYDAEPR